MPQKSKKTKKSSKKGQKTAFKKGATGKQKNGNALTVDAVAQAATKARALEAQLYFQRSEMQSNQANLESANIKQFRAEYQLINFQKEMAEANAFGALQHEHTVKKLTDRLQELLTANENLKQENNDLTQRLEDAREQAKVNNDAHEAEILRLSEIITESSFQYGRILNQFGDNLIERLVGVWEEEKSFIEEQEGDIYQNFQKNNFLPFVDEQ